MADFHFVEDYERHVGELINTMPIDEAMSLAVGGYYEQFGAIEFDILRYNGLQNGNSIVDLGCGSGRLATVLAAKWTGEYLGLDVVQSLLNYAKSKCPGHYRFLLNKSLEIPCANASVDMFCAFSVFTHLLQAEIYLYLKDMHRGLKQGGTVVFSFLEFHTPAHWWIFEATVEDAIKSVKPPLNQFIERNQIEVWAEHIGFRSARFIDGMTAPWPSGEPLGQSTAVLTK